MKIRYFALVSLVAFSLIGCNSDGPIKPEESMGSQFEQAKKEGAVAPDVGKGKSTKATPAPPVGANAPADNKPN